MRVLLMLIALAAGTAQAADITNTQQRAANAYKEIELAERAMAKELAQAAHMAVRSVAMYTVWNVSTVIAAHLDAPTLAANQVVTQLFMFLALVLDALAVPLHSLVAGELGAGRGRGGVDDVDDHVGALLEALLEDVLLVGVVVAAAAGDEQDAERLGRGGGGGRRAGGFRWQENWRDNSRRPGGCPHFGPGWIATAARLPRLRARRCVPVPATAIPPRDSRRVPLRHWRCGDRHRSAAPAARR